jgi:endonuclease/exonuclease/phosphatase family metal-dependent hydrolase
MRVATQNLHCLDANPSGRLDTAAARYAQLGVDAVTLQEACIDASQTDTATQLAARLAARSGRPWKAYFLQTHLANGSTPEGVAVITPLPVAQARSLSLPTVSFGRSSVRVVVASGVGMASVSTEHLSFETTASGAQDRLNQINAILPFEAAEAPLVAAQVVAGDLNSTPSDPPAQTLSSAGFSDAWVHGGATGNGFSYPTVAPSERIDFIFVTGVAPSEVVQEFPLQPDGGSVSDHLGVSARLTVP